MAMVPWRPFGDFDRFFEDDDWFLPIMHGSGMAQPAMDLYETDKDVIAKMNLPDIDPDKVDVVVENGVLRVSGATEEQKEEEKKGYYRKEIRKGSFARATRLPSPVKEDAVAATYEKGVLKIVMPKTVAKKEKPKKIKVAEKK